METFHSSTRSATQWRRIRAVTVRAQTKSVGGPRNRGRPTPTNNLRLRNTNYAAQILGRKPADRAEYALHSHHTAANTRFSTFQITTSNFKLGLQQCVCPSNTMRVERLNGLLIEALARQFSGTLLNLHRRQSAADCVRGQITLN